jgi:hypothetical protein
LYIKVLAIDEFETVPNAKALVPLDAVQAGDRVDAAGSYVDIWLSAHVQVLILLTDNREV